MKSLFLAFAIGLMATIAQADMTNGVFYVDNDVECRLIAQNGAMTTNYFLAGNTYTVGEQLMEMDITNATMFCFAGGPIIQASSNSTLIINLFEHEVKNRHASPRRAEFGPCNLSIGFNRGEFTVIYLKADPMSSITILTPHTGRLYLTGKYVFLVDEKETTVSVVEGARDLSKGKPISNKNALASRTKTITTTKPLTPEEINRYTVLIAEIEKKAAEVSFIIVSGNVQGVWLPK